MTIREAIGIADGQKPNAFTDADKIRWINQVEGTVQADVLLLAPEEWVTYTAADMDTALIVRPPHDKIYTAYLVAMIDFANNEYDKYGNTSAMYNAFYEEFVRWFARTYRPADVRRERN